MMSRFIQYWKEDGKHNQMYFDDIFIANRGATVSVEDEFVSNVLNDMRQRRKELVVGEGTYEMANVRPDRTGLPFIVYISERGNSKHAARVKIAPGPRANEFVASVSVEPEVKIVAGNLEAADLELLRKWIDLNKEVILGYWNREIEYTEDALDQLKSIKNDQGA